MIPSTKPMAIVRSSNSARGIVTVTTKMDAGVTSAVHGTRFVAGKLIQGVGWTVDEVGKGFEMLGKGIDDVGKWIAPGTERKAGAASSSGGR